MLRNHKGLSFPEVAVVIIIIGIFISLAVLGVNAYRVNSQGRICKMNRVTVGRYYEAHQTIDGCKQASCDADELVDEMTKEMNEPLKETNEEMVWIEDEETPLGSPEMIEVDAFKVFCRDHFDVGCPRGGVYEWRDGRVWCSVCD